MAKHTLLVFFLSTCLIFSATGFHPVNSVQLTDEERAVLIYGDAPTTEDGVKQGGDNVFVKVLKAPFKAIGRLFGRGGKKDDNKLHRLSQKDVKKFESAGMTRIVDARSAPPTPEPATTTEVQPATSPVTDSVDANEAVALEHLQRGRTFLNAGQLNEAIASLSTAVSFNRKLYEAHNLLGVAYEAKGIRSKAITMLALAVEGDEDNPEHLNNFGYVLYKNGEYDRAHKYLKRAVKLAPTQQRYWNNLALIQTERGKFDDAYKSFVRASGEFEGRMNIATRLQRRGYYKDAIKHLEKAREIQTTLDILARLAVMYDYTGRGEAALEARKSLLALQAQTYAPAK